MSEHDWRIVRLNETRDCGDDWIQQNKIKETGVYYLYDASSRTHLCELTPSYELWAVESYVTFTDEVSDEWRERVDDEVRIAMYDRYLIYVHCTDLSGKPSKSFLGGTPDREEGQDDEAYYSACVEAIQEYLNGNPPCF